MTHTIRKTFDRSIHLRRTVNRVFGVSALCAFLAPTAYAQPLGEGPLVLRLPSSARVAAMANAGLVSTDGDAMFYNPGMLASSRGAAISMQRYGSASTAGSMGTTSTVGPLTIGVGAQFVSYLAPGGVTYADVIKPGATHLSDGGSVSASSTAFTFGVGRTIKGTRLGVNLKYVEDRLGASHDGTAAFDIGMSRALGPGTVGLVVQNLGVGPRLEGIKGTLPRRIGVGFGGYQAVAGHWDVGAQLALTLEGDLFVRPAGGAELAYVPIEGVTITLRQGFRRPRERDESLITAGLGVTVDRISIDYAMEPMRGGRPVSHRVGLRIRP